MSEFAIYHVDAFTSNIFGGNPAAVMPLIKWLPDELMQCIAQENNLSETAFYISEGDHHHIRWFTPSTEVDLCGHATLASAFVLFDQFNYDKKIINFNSRSGILQVILQDDNHLTLSFPVDLIKKVAPFPMLEEALACHIEEIYKGKDDYLVVLQSQHDVEHLHPDFRMISKIQSRGVIVTAEGENSDFVSRCFYPQVGIDEDPVTGSAHTALTPYWSKRLQKTKLTARQLSKRGGQLLCELKEHSVEISGNAALYSTGRIFV